MGEEGNPKDRRTMCPRTPTMLCRPELSDDDDILEMIRELTILENSQNDPGDDANQPDALASLEDETEDDFPAKPLKDHVQSRLLAQVMRIALSPLRGRRERKGHPTVDTTTSSRTFGAHAGDRREGVTIHRDAVQGVTRRPQTEVRRKLVLTERTNLISG